MIAVRAILAMAVLSTAQIAIAEDCPIAGYWVGTAHSINLANGSVGKSVHGCRGSPTTGAWFGLARSGARRQRTATMER